MEFQERETEIMAHRFCSIPISYQKSKRPENCWSKELAVLGMGRELTLIF